MYDLQKESSERKILQRVILYEGAKIGYVREGLLEDAVVFCHGDTQNHTAGLHLLDVFPKMYSRISVDFPGHGVSQDIPDRTLQKESALLKKILEKERCKAIVVGHSKGANLAAVFAIEYPAYVKSLVLLNPFFMNPEKVFWYLPVQFLVKKYLQSAWGQYHPEKTAHVYGDEQSEEEIRKVGLQYTPYAVLEQNVRLYEKYDIREKMQTVDVPVLMMMATKDLLTSKRHIKRVAKRMSNARIVGVRGTHNMHLLAKDAVVEVLHAQLGFLGV